MKKMKILCAALLLFTLSYAKNSTVKLTYENFNFDNSMMKEKGKTYGIALGHQTDTALYQIAYEKSNTNTFKPPLPKDLNVNKYYLKYTHKLDDKQSFSVGYATIDDNLMKETDGGHIYGLGYRYAAFGLTQYLSDYAHFNVYQTDMKYTFKKQFGGAMVSATVFGKYIHLQDKNSNKSSKNANENYFTPGIKIHAHHHGYHVGAGALFGKRIFAVMNDGFKVQHHAMEFNKTYMVGLGKDFGDLDLHLKYVYQEATEVPMHNDNVEVKNIILQLGYHF